MNRACSHLARANVEYEDLPSRGRCHNVKAAAVPGCSGLVEGLHCETTDGAELFPACAQLP